MVITDIRARMADNTPITRDEFICCEAKVYIHKNRWIEFLEKYSDCSVLVDLEEERAKVTTKS